jgi:hypothetical protein
MMILRAGFMGPHVIATSVFLGALVILFCGFAYQIGRLVLGEPSAEGGATADRRRWTGVWPSRSSRRSWRSSRRSICQDR